MTGSSLMYSAVALVALMGAATYAQMAYPHGKVVSCYYASWAFYRPGDGSYDIDDIDASLCTHGFYGFADLNNITWEIMEYDPWFDLAPEDCEPGYCNYDSYRRFVAIKDRYPHFSPILSVGGWNAGSGKYSIMAQDPVKRTIFVDSTIAKLREFGFEGIDLDWEYPGYREGGNSDIDAQDLVLLTTEFKEKLDQYGLILTSAMACGYDKIEVAYDVPAMIPNFEFFNIMAYDYHGWFPGHEFTGHNSPLQNRPSENEESDPGYLYNLKDTVELYESLGMSATDMVIGVPTYGRGFQLADPDVNGLYCPAIDGFPMGPYTRQRGHYGYNEVLEAMTNDTLWNLPHANKDGWTIVRDDCYKAPYMYQNEYWLSYDDPESIAYKIRYANFKNAKGAMIWSLETDDFTGKNSPYPYPLLVTINQELTTNLPYDPSEDYLTCGNTYMCQFGENPGESTTTQASTASTTTSGGLAGACTEHMETLPYPGDCHRYYRCFDSDGDGTFTTQIYNCSNSWAWDPNTQSCVDLGLPANCNLCGTC